MDSVVFMLAKNAMKTKICALWVPTAANVAAQQLWIHIKDIKKSSVPFA